MATVTVERVLPVTFTGVLDWPNYPPDARLPNDLARGTQVLLSKGPMPSDGIEWYEVYFTPIAGEPFADLGYGWISAGSSGDPPTNIAIGPLRCPDALTPGNLGSMTTHARLGCLGGTDHELVGVLHECSPIPAGLGMTLWDYTNCFDIQDANSTDSAATGTSLFFPPTVDTSELRPGQEVRVVGHLDDPAAETCRSNRLGAPAAADDLQVINCRGAVVVSEIEVLG